MNCRGKKWRKWQNECQKKKYTELVVYNQIERYHGWRVCEPRCVQGSIVGIWKTENFAIKKGGLDSKYTYSIQFCRILYYASRIIQSLLNCEAFSRIIRCFIGVRIRGIPSPTFSFILIVKRARACVYVFVYVLNSIIPVQCTCKSNQKKESFQQDPKPHEMTRNNIRESKNTRFEPTEKTNGIFIHPTPTKTILSRKGERKKRHT